MAEQLRDYHESLQNDGVNEDNTESCEDDINTVLEQINVRLQNNQRDKVAEPVSEEEVNTLLDRLANGKAAGIDGIPYEFWRALKPEFERDTKNKVKNTLDVVKLLILVFNDIQNHGMAKGTGF
ncbi:hypothetical protein C8J56DRAFT_733544, partial [Mycena floridula]